MIDVDPQNKGAWRGKGICLSSLNRFLKSLDCFDKALEIEPEDGEAWYLKSMRHAFYDEIKKKSGIALEKPLNSVRSMLLKD